ncbi:MAG: ATP-binding protein [Candidatus Hadarchaeales archaeon]
MGGVSEVVTPKRLKFFLRRDLLTNKYCVYIWGPPGVGKTECVLQLAKELNLPVRVLNVALEHPHTLGGFPVPSWKEKVMSKLPPKIISELEGEGILFFDDFAAAEPQQQRVSLSLTTYRRVGDYVLPDGIRVIFASNRVKDFSYVVKPSLAILNRCKHYVLYPSLDDWCDWLRKVSVDLSEFDRKCWENVPREVAALVTTFLKFFPHHFFVEPSAMRDDVVDTVAFPTPRSWTNFMRDLGIYIKEKGYPDVTVDEVLRDKDDVLSLLVSWVGDTPAADFLKYTEVDRKKLNEMTRNWKKLKTLPIYEQSLYALFVYFSLFGEEEKDEFVSYITKNLHSEALAVLSFHLKGDERVREGDKLQVAASALPQVIKETTRRDEDVVEGEFNEEDGFPVEEGF